MSKTVEVRLNFTAETSSAEQALNKLQSSLRNITNQQNLDLGGYKLSNELNQASEAAIKLRQNLQNAINVNTNSLDLTKFNKEMQKSGMSLEKYRTALVQIGPSGQAAFADLAKAIVASESPLTRSLGLLDKLWDTLKRTAGWQISSNIMHGFQSSLSDAYKYAQNLNKSLNDIRIVTGYGADRMADFAKQANKAAKELSATTLDYTDASLIYYQQGLDDKAVKERTDTTIKMANVTGTTAQTVSQQMTAVWENFMKDGEHAAEYYADVMTALGAATASSTDEIADGLEKFAAVADTVGLSYEYATAALTTITAKTRQSADVVGTALKTLFARIEGLNLGETLDDGTTLNKYSSALDAVGVNIKNEAGELKDMDEILDEIGSKWETIGKDQQIALAQTVAGVRQYTQFVALMDNWDFMGENLATAYSAEGTLDEQQKIYEESWEAARNRLQASMETLYDDLLKDDFFIWLTDALSDVVGLIDKIVDSMGGLAGLLPGLVLLMNKLWGDKIAAGISTAAYNIGGLIPSIRQARNEADQQLREQAMSNLQTMYQTQGDATGTAVVDVYAQINKLQQYRLNNADKLTAQESQQLSLLIDQARVEAEMVENMAKQVDASNQQAKAQQNALFVSAKVQKNAMGNEFVNLNPRANEWLKTWGGPGDVDQTSVESTWNQKVDVTQGNKSARKKATRDQKAIKDAKSQITELFQELGSASIQEEDIDNYLNQKKGNNQGIIKTIFERLNAYQFDEGGQANYFNDLINGIGDNAGLKYYAKMSGKLSTGQEQLGQIDSRLQNEEQAMSTEQVESLKADFQSLINLISEAGGETEKLQDRLDNLNIENANAEAQILVKEIDEAFSNTATGNIEKLRSLEEKLAKQFKLDTKQIEVFRNTLIETGSAEQALARAMAATKDSATLQEKAIAKLGKTVTSLQKIQNAITTVTSLAMGISSLRSAIDAINNPDLSGWEKFTSVAMSVSMAASSLMGTLKGVQEIVGLVSGAISLLSAKIITNKVIQDSANASTWASIPALKSKEMATLAVQIATEKLTIEEGAKKIAELAGIPVDAATTIAERILAEGRDKLTAKTIILAAVEAIKNGVFLKSLTTILALIGPYILLAAALGGVAFIIAKVIQAYQNQETAQEKAARQADEAARATENAKKAYEELCNTIDSYESGVDKLKDLEEGTLEFKQALIDTNEQALELIDKLNLIYGKDWKYDDQGKIVFLDENGNVDNDFLKKKEEEAADKVLANQQAQAHYDNEKKIADVNDYFENYDYAIDKNGKKTTISYDSAGNPEVVAVKDSKQEGMEDIRESKLSTAEIYKLAQQAGLEEGQDTMSDDTRKEFYRLLKEADFEGNKKAVKRLMEDLNVDDQTQIKIAEIDKNIDAYRSATASEEAQQLDTKAESNANDWVNAGLVDQKTANTILNEEANINTAIKTNDKAQELNDYTDEEILNKWYEEQKLPDEYQFKDGKLQKQNEEGDWEEVDKDDQYYISADTAKEMMQRQAVEPEIQQNTADALLDAATEKALGNETSSSGKANAEWEMSRAQGESFFDEERTVEELQDFAEANDLSLKQVNELYEARQKYNTMLFDSLEGEQKSLVETASDYSSCSDEVTELKDAVKKYGKESKAAQDAQKKLNQALKNAQWTKFAKNIASAIKELKDLDKNGDDYKDKCQEIASAYNEIFDSDITADFVADNIDLFNEWANSSGEKAGQLATEITMKANMASEKFAEGLSSIDWSEGWKGINSLSDAYNWLGDFIANNPIQMDAEGHADLSQMIQSMIDAGATAEQVAAMLSAIGQTEVELNGTIVSTADIANLGSEKFTQGLLKNNGLINTTVTGGVKAKGTWPHVDASKLMDSSSGGGGGGSKKDPKKSSDEIERYHVVKQQLDRLSSEYNQLSAAKDRAYGPDKLKAIDKEIAKLQEQEAMQKRYLDEINRYYQQDRQAIAKYGAVFDANGIITNYDALMQKQLDIFNASLTDEAEEAYNTFKETLDQYEETLALKLEEAGNLLDKQYEIVSAKLEKITYKVEYKVEIEEDKLDYLERRLTRLSDVEKASLEVFAINQEKIMSYWSQYATYTEAIKGIEAQINEQRAKGLEITDEQIQKLRDYKKALGEMEDNIYELYNDEIDKISDRYSNLFDQLENYQDRIRDYRDSLETIKDMYSLLGVATVEDNRAMNDSIRKTYQAEARGIQNEIDLLKARREELDKANKSLGVSTDEQGELIEGLVSDIKKLENVGDLTIMEDSAKAYSQKLQDQINEIDQQVHEKQMELISLASDYLNAIKDQWVENLELIGQKTKDALYEGLEWAIDKYGDLTDLSELYLSNTRKIYELNKLNRNIQADINKLDSIVAKTKLRDLMKDINGYYADNVKMSEYELKNLQAQYELRLAEIALEDARNAKSEVRLTRDNEGRWGYMYTANTEEVDKAEQELEDKQYALQELQEDTLKDAGEKILSLQNDYIDAMTELQSSDLSDEQKQKRAEELTSLYQKQLDYYYKTYAQALEASGLAYEETILGQATNTKSLQEVMETFGHASIEMTGQMISETQKYQDAFTQMVRDITGEQVNSYEEAQKAWLDYMGGTRAELTDATTEATKNFNKVAKAIKEMSQEFRKMINELMVYLAQLSGEDMSLLFQEALANGNYDLAVKYAQARRSKIDANPEKYGKYDWTDDDINRIIGDYAKDPNAISDEQRNQMYATTYGEDTDYSIKFQNALRAGDYERAVLYAEMRKQKMDSAPEYRQYAWSKEEMEQMISKYARDNTMTDEQRRRILATAGKYDTGGYTGAWGNEGRWALLHEKELVLNKSDTSNLLATITLLHDLMARLDQASVWSALRELTPASAATATEILEQNVHIEASFPNAVDHNEIEQAFENIVNLASQYANRK